MKKIRFLGDWAPGHKKVLMHDIQSLFLINIEGPIINKKINFPKKIKKAGPHLYSKTLPNNDNFIAILSNNHLMDYGEHGLNLTLEELNRRQIKYVGAGKSKKEADKPLIFCLENLKFALFARCEKQFGIAQENISGCAGLENDLIKQIEEIKKKVDFIILSLHGGAEMLAWPSPKRQDFYRLLIDKGVDIVYGHHAHVPQSWEKYQKGVIFYGLGNFCVDLDKWQNISNTSWSLTPIVSFEKGKIEVEEKISEIEIINNQLHVKEINSVKKNKFEKYLNKAKKPLTDRALLIGIWHEFSLINFKKYYSKWLGLDTNRKYIFFTIMKNTLLLISTFLPDTIIKSRLRNNIKNKLLLIYHLFSCKTHNESIETAMGLLSGEIKSKINAKSKSYLENQYY